jgi:Dolichyl-phosphate-mannose-protein mannosyltransferase
MFKKPETALVYLLVFIKFLFPFFVQDASFELSKYEMLYVAQGNHFAWGFAENAPLISWLAAISNSIANNIYIIKLWPALFGAGTLFICCQIVLELGAKTFPVFLCFLCFFFDAYLRVFFDFQPMFLEIFFYSAIALSIVKLIGNKNNNWGLVLGFSAGLGLLSNITMLFFIAATLLGLLLSNKRNILLKPKLIIGLCVAIAIAAPYIIWLINQHQDIAFFANNYYTTQFYFSKPSNLFEGIIFVLLPCCFIWIIGLLYIVTLKKAHNFLVFFYSFLLMVLVLWFYTANAFAMLPMLPVLLAFGAYNIERITVRHFRLGRYLSILPIIYFGFINLPLVMPFLGAKDLAKIYEERNIKSTGALNWTDSTTHQLPQDLANMLGWKEFANKVNFYFNSISEAEQSQTLILCNDKYITASLDFYAQQCKLKNICCATGCYKNWLPTNVPIKNIIYITTLENIDTTKFGKFNNSYLAEDIKNIDYLPINGLKIYVNLNASEQNVKMF